jgi:hypothetical protein
MIVIQKASGGVSVMRLLNGADADKCVEQWKAVNPGEYVSHAEVAETDLPKDRAARTTWRLVNGKVVAGPAPAPADKARNARLAWGASMGLTPAQVNALFPT